MAAMTLDVEPRPVPRARKIGRRAKLVLVVLAALALVSIGYLARYGQCEAGSKFCSVDVIGTRSAVGIEWETATLYVTTYPDGVIPLWTVPVSR